MREASSPRPAFQPPSSTVVRARQSLQPVPSNFDGDKLTLANLTSATLKRLGADGRLSSCDSYDLPQQWSVWIHGHPANVDGFVYVYAGARSANPIAASTMSAKIGRNDPCPCGSGRKYKYCCGRAAVTRDPDEKGHAGTVERALEATAAKMHLELLRC
ncbi:MAG TPA: SEC-C metal-binding domain-containing protein [Terriglobia bacterium]|nr:SEC-C metal-binding domain-containing protein [Terriglobia bacterium]